MIRLNRIYIKGFKDPERVVDFEFSTENITVVFGANGCGKTTLLRILHAIFVKNEGVLKEENVQYLSLFFSVNGQEQKLTVKTTKMHRYDWQNAKNLQTKCSSVFLGTYRGIAQQSQQYKEMSKKSLQKLGLGDAQEGAEVVTQFIYNMAESLGKNNPAIGLGLESLKKVVANSIYPDAVLEMDNENTQHRLLDGVNMTTIENELTKEFYLFFNNEKKLFDEVLWKTLSDFVDLPQTIEITERDLEVIEANKKAILILMLDETGQARLLPNNKLQTLTIDYLNGNAAALNESMHLKAYLKNIATLFERRNNEIDEHKEGYVGLWNALKKFWGDKKALKIVDNKIQIELARGQVHDLHLLSQGERHLLALLFTVFIKAKGTNFILIDEPENSLNVSWQHNFLPAIKEINSQAQIIVASHSPAIVHKNRNYLKELK